MIARLRKLANQHVVLVYSAIALAYVVYSLVRAEPSGAIGAAFFGWFAGLIWATEEGERALARERQHREWWYVHRSVIDRHFVPRDRTDQ